MGSEKEAMEAAKALDGTKLLGRQVGRLGQVDDDTMLLMTKDGFCI